MQRISQVWPGWQVDGLIGQGAFGRVYQVSRTFGEHTSRAAVKIIDIPRDESEIVALSAMGMDALSVRSYFEDTAQSVLREIALMDELKGAPGIVHIEDYHMLERKDGVGWTILIRMELLESLTAYLQRTGMPDQREAARIGVEVCRGLEHCHARGLIHRDVKPDNVFRTEFGEYRLGDFGLARRISEGSRSALSHAGTSDFMAPEVESGHYDARVDTYSLGIMLYRWLNGGRPPFVGAGETPTRDALERARYRRLSGERPPLPAGPGVDPALAAIVRRAVEPKPADRWPSAAAFGGALQAWIEGGAASPSPQPVRQQAPAATTKPLVSGAMGIHVDQAGNVLLCQGASAPALLAPALRLGTVAVGEDGTAAPGDLDTFLATRLVDASAACVTTNLQSYQTLARSKRGRARWVSTTVALAIDYALTELAGKQGELRFFTLHQEGRLVSLAAFEWGDGVLEVYDTCATTVEPFERLADALARLLEHEERHAGHLLLEEVVYPVAYLADEQDLSAPLGEAYAALEKARLPKPQARLRLFRRQPDAAARGAALQSMVLHGLLSDFLLLDALPFGLGLAFGDHRLALLACGTTVPTIGNERIRLREGERISVEVEAYGERGQWQRYELPVSASRLKALASGGHGLDVSAEVDANLTITIRLAAQGWSQSFSLGKLSPASRGAQASETADRHGADAAATPDGLLELIATLDDVDLGVRALGQDDLQTPAGAGMVALQGRLLQAIAKTGAEYYPALGETFDPHRHEAMGTLADPTLPADYVVDELRRGYRYQGRIIRYSLVRVANPS